MRRNFIKKLRENKTVVIIICVIIVSIVYFGAQKAIDNFVFERNGDIVTEESVDWGVEDNEESESREGEMQLSDGSGMFSDEDVDLVLEEEENSTEIEDITDGGAEGENATSLGNSAKETDKKASEMSKIYVYITGEVNNPGVVILNEGSRIVDAINAAGGTTIKANVSKVNLVYVLDDGMKVNIPNNNDLKNNPDFEYITMNSGDGGNDDYSANSGGASASVSSSGNSSSSSSESYNNYSVVNINTATQTELETLPGIGPSLALKIINYRKENGKFSSIEEIKNVSGIGDSKFEELKGYITV